MKIYNELYILLSYIYYLYNSLQINRPIFLYVLKVKNHKNIFFLRDINYDLKIYYIIRGYFLVFKFIKYKFKLKNKNKIISIHVTPRLRWHI